MKGRVYNVAHLCCFKSLSFLLMPGWNNSVAFMGASLFHPTEGMQSLPPTSPPLSRQPVPLWWNCFSSAAKVSHKGSPTPFKRKQPSAGGERGLEPEKLWFASQLYHLLSWKRWAGDSTSLHLSVPIRAQGTTIL